MLFRTLWLTTGTTDCLCYKFNTQKSSGRVSRYKCSQGGGHLVTMETEEKWRFINSKIQGINVGMNEWYIGLEKKGREWKWVNNQTLSINKWQSFVNEPNNDGNCVAMAKNYPPGKQGLFKDLPCHLPLMSMCEYSQGNPRCTDGYYPPGCNETNLASTPGRTTQFLVTSTKPTEIKEATAIHKTQAAISIPNNKTSLASPTTTYPSKDASEPFPITLVTAAFIGILLIVFICLIIAVCFWKTGGMGSRSKHKDDSQRNASETAEVPGIELDVITSKSNLQNIPKIDALIYAEIKDDHARSNPQTSTYAEVHDCLSAPVPEYIVPYEAVEQHKGPAYQPLNKKDSAEDEVALAASSSSENQNGVPKIDPDEQRIVTNAVYATVDKSMKKKSVQKQVEPVYAQVNKNDKTI